MNKMSGATRRGETPTPSTEQPVFVLDDDPTGTQNVSDVDVLLDLRDSALNAFLNRDLTRAYVLTNTRALAEAEAVLLVARVTRMARRAHPDCMIVLRGDSTLRGHTFAEIEAVDPSCRPALFVPAFPQAGRVTVNGVHLLKVGQRSILISDSEFAKDPVFGFDSSHLGEWVRRQSRGRWRAELVGPNDVAMAIRESPERTVIVPDASTDSDISAIADQARCAWRDGARFVVRAAPALAASLAGLGSRIVAHEAATPILLVCGSHTDAATRQLDALAPLFGTPIIMSSDESMGPDRSETIERVASEVRARLRLNSVALLATERHRSSQHLTLRDGAAVMSGLVDVVKSVSGLVGLVVAKGGITSADVARVGLGATAAHVEGQMMAGVAMWTLVTPGGPRPYVVVPGNVGDDRTLARLMTLLAAK